MEVPHAVDADELGCRLEVSTLSSTHGLTMDARDDHGRSG
jgi:hypothetical protein